MAIRTKIPFTLETLAHAAEQHLELFDVEIKTAEDVDSVLKALAFRIDMEWEVYVDMETDLANNTTEIPTDKKFFGSSLVYR